VSRLAAGLPDEREDRAGDDRKFVVDTDRDNRLDVEDLLRPATGSGVEVGVALERKAVEVADWVLQLATAVKLAADIVILAFFAVGLSACGTVNSSLPPISAAQVASGQPLPEGILPNGIVYDPYL
jgi:hypothetical protein